MSVGHESIDASNYRALRFERQGDVLIITIDHPSNKLNAVDDVLHTELTRLFADLKRESRARAAVITGAGRIFSAGGDFDWFPTLSNLEALEHLRRDAKQMIWDLLDVPIPIVAAVNGPAVGLGASLALLCVPSLLARYYLLDEYIKICDSFTDLHSILDAKQKNIRELPLDELRQVMNAATSIRAAPVSSSMCAREHAHALGFLTRPPPLRSRRTSVHVT